jgi:hypothetical protein
LKYVGGGGGSHPDSEYLIPNKMRLMRNTAGVNYNATDHVKTFSEILIRNSEEETRVKRGRAVHYKSK